MQKQNKTLKLIIIVLCFLVPVLVGVLYLLPDEVKDMGLNTSYLPRFNAFLNSSTAILLVLAVLAVKKGNYKLHKTFMISAIILGAVFLLSYVAYHLTTASVKFGDANFDGVLSAMEMKEVATSRIIYLFILISHILLSFIVLPLVLISAYRGVTENNEKHKKIVKYSFPIWLYVSITGVIVYFMLSPYYVV